MNKSLMIFCLTLSIAGNAQAISVTETTDFPGSSSFGSNAFSAGTLDLGANTISGSLNSQCVVDTFDCNMDMDTDSQDSFLVEVGTTTMIDSIFVTTSDVTGPTGFNSSFNLRDASTDHIFEPNLPNNATTDNLVDTALGAGIYSISMFGQHAQAAGTYMLDWSVEVNVAPVPVPAAIWLFGTGLLGLIGFSKHRKP